MVEHDDTRLYRLGELKDFEVADDDPDVRGWDVLAADDKKIGTVDELIVDTGSMKVRYLDVKVHDEITGVDDHHLLIPIGTASIDEKKDLIRAGNVEVVTLLKYPKYEGEAITRDYENQLRKSYNPDYNPDNSGKNYYNNEYYNDEKFYSSRRKKNLFRLHEMQGYEIKGVDPDIRNWEVESSDGNRIGRVYELIVDPEIKKIRYIEVESEINRGKADEVEHILLPVGLCKVDEKDNRVRLKTDFSQLTRYPLYRGGDISRTYEETLRNSISMDSLSSKDTDDEFYNNEYYNDSEFYGGRGSGVRWV